MEKLSDVRGKLIQLEDLIIMSLFSRAQYKRNSRIYEPGKIHIDGYSGSFFDYLFSGTERIHASAGRFEDSEERPFYDFTKSIAKRDFEQRPKVVNMNKQIRKSYFYYLPKICPEGEDKTNFGNAAIADINCLQNISKRVHLGEQIAEAKFQENPKLFSALIHAGDIQDITDKITNQNVEASMLERIKEKGRRYDFDSDLICRFYKDEIIQLTKEVEIRYLVNKM